MPKCGKDFAFTSGVCLKCIDKEYRERKKAKKKKEEDGEEE